VKVIGGDEQVAFPKGTAWQVVVDAGEHENPDLNACWCFGDGQDAAKYCESKGWVYGVNNAPSIAQIAIKAATVVEFAARRQDDVGAGMGEVLCR
jgi:hypothetical protein